MPRLYTLIAALLLTSASAQAAFIEDQTFVDLAPQPHHKSTAINIVKQLEQRHYVDLRIDETASPEIFSNYFDALDRQRSYFLQSEVDSFSGMQETLVKNLRKGNLDEPFKIFNLYQRRVLERLDFMLTRLGEGAEAITFDNDDVLLADREELDWPPSKSALEDLWRRQLKAAALSLKLAGKVDNEIRELLYKRYRSQKNRALQAKSEDAFQVYMNAVTSLYDPHTEYHSPRNSENFNINMSLSLEGIGAVLQSENEYTKVVRLVPAGPADKAGELQPADRIVGVGQGNEEVVDVIGWRLDEVVDLIRGPKQTVVKLEVIPADSADESTRKTLAITRDQVKLEEQAAKKSVIELTRASQNYKVGVIDIPTFYADFRAIQAGDPNYKSTTRDVRRLLGELNQENIDGLIIDLRGNGGGSLAEANELTGLFIKAGPTVQIRAANNRVDILNDPDPDIAYGGPLIVLVDRLSASASEIFAGAIQDYNRGLVIGGQTFGKGTVQAVRPLDRGERGQLKITQAKFYRVSGESTQHKGVVPDIEYPSVYDRSRIGEDALPEALPWDQIRSVRYKRYPELSPLLGQLSQRHLERVEANPEYQILLDEIDHLREVRENTIISLNEKQRLEEREQRQQRQLDIVNRRRALEGKTPLKSADELEGDDETTAAAEEADNSELDFLLTESGQILVDLLELRQTVAVKDHSDAQSLTP